MKAWPCSRMHMPQEAKGEEKVEISPALEEEEEKEEINPAQTPPIPSYSPQTPSSPILSPCDPTSPSSCPGTYVRTPVTPPSLALQMKEHIEDMEASGRPS